MAFVASTRPRHHEARKMFQKRMITRLLKTKALETMPASTTFNKHGIVSGIGKMHGTPSNDGVLPGSGSSGRVGCRGRRPWVRNGRLLTSLHGIPTWKTGSDSEFWGGARGPWSQTARPPWWDWGCGWVMPGRPFC